MSASVPYHEELLHWMWKNQRLQNEALRTHSGKSISVHHPGYANATDGPDFKNARISIGGLKWHGDVEIHWTGNDWLHHRHHTDPNFNRVILHVVYDDSKTGRAHRQDNTAVPTLSLKPFLSEPLQHFFMQFQKPDSLACAGNLASVPPQIIHDQFNQAHREYFEQKINDLLQFYDPALPLSQAWQHMLVIALFDGLGITHNREPMQKLARLLLAEYPPVTGPDSLVKSALRLAGVQPKNPDSNFGWKRKGSRPANHPKNRIRQACLMLHFIKKRSLKWWLRTGMQESFDALLQHVETTPQLGRRQAGVLYGIVWLPACYLLGDLTGNSRIKKRARKLWLNHRTPLPGSIKKYFAQADIPPDAYTQKLGAVHQLRAYCRPHHCQQCKVFKHVISS